MNDASGNIKKLAKEAPAFASRLLSCLDEELQRVIAHDYVAVADLGGNDEFGVMRGAEASFNPRLARITLLVMKEGRQQGVLAIRAALWGAIRREQRPRLDGDIEVVLDDLDREAPERSDSLAIGMALALDRIRHLHMTSLPSDEQYSILEHGQWIARCAESVSELERLRRKLLHTVTLQQRRLDRE